MKKTLIAYFSRKGNNYVSGKIVDLPMGNTQVAAQKIQSMVGGDLFEIQTVRTYSEDYTECTHQASDELRANARPELRGTLPSLDDYEVIYIGYPIWCGTMPMCMFTFLENFNFSGKTIVPFCTNEGSGKGKSEGDINALCKDAKIHSGLALVGGKVASADEEIKTWLRSQNLI